MKAYPLTPTKDQVAAILREAEQREEFDYMLFLTLKSTGRRIGELYGIQEQKRIGHKKTGRTRQVFVKGQPLEIDITLPIYKKKSGVWRFGVRVKDIDFEKGTMKVVVLKRKKYAFDDTVLTPENLRVIRSYVRKNRLRPDDMLFRKKGRSLRQIQHLIKKYAKLAGVPLKINRGGTEYSISLHSFRHYFITELKRQGWTDDYIIKITGHKSANTLRNYDHVVAEDIRDKFLNAAKEM